MRSRIGQWLKRQWKEWRGTVYFTVFVFIPLRSILADWNWVPTGSMNPTILEGDMVYVNKAAYGLRVPLTTHRLCQWSAPRRGDVVVLLSPEDGTRLVKRVVGLPGDQIELQNNRLLINGQPVSYAALPEEAVRGLQPGLRLRSIFAREDLSGKERTVMSTPQLPAMRSFGSILVPAGHYFVMGDNRDNSKDSRYFGCVENHRLLGRVQGTIVSFNKLDWYQPRLSRFFSRLE